MTEALKPLVASLASPNWQYSYLTSPVSPNSPASINNNEDVLASTKAIIPCLDPSVLAQHDAFLVACYSAHPLVPWLRKQPPILYSSKAVTGIFEASIGAALAATGVGAAELGGSEKEVISTFGIVSTGAAWGPLLTDAVKTFVGGRTARFAGVQTTGLSATELHTANPDEVHQRLVDATLRLLRAEDPGTATTKRNVGAICLGCAGMAGMDTIVRDTCKDELGIENGKQISVIDGVVEGIVCLEGMIRSRERGVVL